MWFCLVWCFRNTQHDLFFFTSQQMCIDVEDRNEDKWLYRRYLWATYIFAQFCILFFICTVIYFEVHAQK